MSKVPNPLPFLTGPKLGAYLRHNDFPQPNTKQGPPIIIPAGKPRKPRKPSGGASYDKRTG